MNPSKQSMKKRSEKTKDNDANDLWLCRNCIWNQHNENKTTKTRRRRRRRKWRTFPFDSKDETVLRRNLINRNCAFECEQQQNTNGTVCLSLIFSVFIIFSWLFSCFVFYWNWVSIWQHPMNYFLYSKEKKRTQRKSNSNDYLPSMISDRGKDQAHFIAKWIFFFFSERTWVFDFSLLIGSIYIYIESSSLSFVLRVLVLLMFFL